MSDINLRPRLQALERGIYGTNGSKNITSKTFVCYLKDNRLQFGFFYKTNRIACLEETDEGFQFKESKTIGANDFTICFRNVITTKPLVDITDDDFTQEDIDLAWFNKRTQKLLKRELLTHKELQEDITENLRLLSIDELEGVKHNLPSKD